MDRAATEAAIPESEMEMTERTKMPMVNKEARVVEEISLSKEVTEHDETIRDMVRDTELDIENLDRTTRNKDNDLLQ